MAQLRSYTTGSGVLSVTLNPGFGFDLEEVRLHLNTASATAENFTIDLDANENAVYDINHITQDMNTVKDLVSDDKLECVNGDKVVVGWANSNSRTYGLELTYTRTTY